MVASPRLFVSLAPLFVAMTYGAQPSAPSPVAAPLRKLPWGQLNFLHTTDIHGWFGGHLQEPQYGADWGDYISFAQHIRDRADKEGKDVLVIDSGDRVEGNGLYDASHPKGKYVFDILKQQNIDLICSGNHELYKANSSENELNRTVPAFKDNYIASNIDILNPETDKFEPLAQRFKKFSTKNQGIRVLAFGFLFDFNMSANNTRVLSVEDTIKGEWFQEAIRDKEVDIILVFGHVAIRSKEYNALFKAIRSQQWDIPIQFFGGHSHIRDFKIYDDASTALESGRYMETIGFLSINGIKSSGGKDKEKGKAAVRGKLSFSRLYIDNNLFSLHSHTGKDDKTFPTEQGEKASKMIRSARKALDLDAVVGCVPKDLYLTRVPYRLPHSLYWWLVDDVMVDQLQKSERARAGKPALYTTNTGAIRFDLFKGPFTKDTAFLVSPFTSGFSFIKDVPYRAASRVLGLLNSGDPLVFASRESGKSAAPPAFLMGPVQQTGMRAQRLEVSALPKASIDASPKHHDQLPLRSDNETSTVNDGHKGINNIDNNNDDDHVDERLIPGYKTRDDAGSDGDDTLHSNVEYYDVPYCVQSPIGKTLAQKDGDFSEPELVDVVFNEYIQPWVLLALQYLGEKYTDADVEVYLKNKTMTDMIADWVGANWPAQNDSCRNSTSSD